MNSLKKEKESSSVKKLLFGSSYYDRYKDYEKYEAKKASIRNDSSLSESQKNYAVGFVDSEQKKSSSESKAAGLVQDTMETAVDSFSDGLQKMILGYQDFKTTMKQMGAELTSYVLKQITDLTLQSLFKMNNLNAAGKTASAAGSWGGGFISAIGGFFKKKLKFHSGGVVPSGANYSLPGAQEQLALLKGGERVLSPSENVNYDSSQGGSSPVVLNNFNIKAWDSKDVRKYLTENRELLNQITFEGIKNNNCQLRNMVKGA